MSKVLALRFGEKFAATPGMRAIAEYAVAGRYRLLIHEWRPVLAAARHHGQHELWSKYPGNGCRTIG